MPVKVVNPLAVTNGTGSLFSPLNAWPSSFSPGDTVLQIGDTIWSGHNGNVLHNIVVNQSGTQAAPIVLGVCEPQTGVRITDGSKKAKVDGTGRYIAVRTGANVGWVTFDGFEVYNVTGDGTTRGVGMYLGSSSSSPSNNCVIQNCHIHDIPNSGFGDDNAIQVFGNDCVVRNVRIHDIADDGIWFSGARGLIEYCDIRRVGLGPDITGDGIQVFGDETLGCGGIVVRYNYVDHTEAEEKQCLILQGHVSTSIGGQAYGNVFKHYKNGASPIVAVYLELLNTAVWGNWIEGGYFGIFAGYTVNGDASNARIFGNVLKDQLIGIDQGGSNVTGAKILNNTVIGSRDYAIYCDNDTSVEVKNNIVANCARGIALEFGATEDYNCLYNIADPTKVIGSLGGGARTIGAHSITTDPLLTSDYRLTALSPCRGAGIYIPGVKHFGGARLRNPADIGAHRWFDNR